MANKDINKDEWMEKILSSAENLQRSEVNPFIFTRIKSRIENAAAPNLISIPKIAAGFTALLILIAMNFGLINSDIKNNSSVNLKNTNSQTQTIPQQINPYLEYLTNY